MFTEKELEMIGESLVYLHTANLENFNKEDVLAMESAMDKLNLFHDDGTGRCSDCV